MGYPSRWACMFIQSFTIHPAPWGFYRLKSWHLPSNLSIPPGWQPQIRPYGVGRHVLDYWVGRKCSLSSRVRARCDLRKTGNIVCHFYSYKTINHITQALLEMGTNCTHLPGCYKTINHITQALRGKGRFAISPITRRYKTINHITQALRFWQYCRFRSYLVTRPSITSRRHFSRIDWGFCGKVRKSLFFAISRPPVPQKPLGPLAT